MSIALEVHICDQRRSYKVTFEGDGPAVEDRALQFVEARWTSHATHELETEPIPAQYGRLLDTLYPQCPHGLSLSNCYGPQHYYYDEEEQARGMRNGW
jgi:hypothetical protein